MTARPTDDRIDKLPRYVKDYIQDLELAHANVLKQLNNLTDSQKPSKVYTEDFVFLEGTKGSTIVKRYFQCDRLTIESAGVTLNIDGIWSDEAIKLCWRPAGKGHPLGDVLFIPKSYQQAELKSLEKGR